MTDLKQTVALMTSDDYRMRFVAEYWQTKIRYEKLKNFCDKIEVGQMWNSGVVEPDHVCPLGKLREQQEVMGKYLHILELRAILERIDLDLPIVSND